MYAICCTFYLFICGVSTSVTRHKDVEYSKYLGANASKLETEYASTIVCNHISWLDPIVLIKNIMPAFAPTSGLKDVPLLRTLIDCLDSIYIPRGGSEENKAQALLDIKKR